MEILLILSIVSSLIIQNLQNIADNMVWFISNVISIFRYNTPPMPMGGGWSLLYIYHVYTPQGENKL